MVSLVHCVYTSRERHALSGAELNALLQHSRESNARNGISGVLLYVGGYFMQVLEGPPERIDELYARIVIDARHTQITRIILEAIPHRFFGEWTMGLSQLRSEEVAQIIGDTSPQGRENLLASVDEGRAKKLLRAFTEGRWRQTVNTIARDVAA